MSAASLTATTANSHAALSALPAVAGARPMRPVQWLALFLILSAAAALRFYHLPARSLWADELQTPIGIHGEGLHGLYAIPYGRLVEPPSFMRPETALPWRATLRPDLDNVHPPLYFALLRPWADRFGWDERGLRSFSAVASLLVVCLMFCIVRELSGTAPALWAAAITAVAEPQIELGQEARSYALAMAISLAAALTAARIERRGAAPLRLAVLFAACLAAPLTHYLTIAVIPTLAIYLAVPLRGRERVRALAAPLGALVVFCIAWGPVVYAQRHGISGDGTTLFVEEAQGHFWNVLTRTVLLPARYLFTPLPNSRPVAAVFAAVAAAPFAVLIARWRRGDPGRREGLLLWALWLPIHVAPTLLIDLTHTTWSLEIIRYTIFASPAVYAITATLTAGLSRPWARHLLPAAAVLGCLLHLDQAFAIDGPQRQNWRRFVHDFNQLARPGDVCVFATGQDPRRFPNQLLAAVAYYSRPMPGPVLLLDRPASNELLAELRQRPNGGAVMLVTDYLSVQSTLPGYRPTGGGRFYDGLARFSRAAPAQDTPANASRQDK